jgi:hypothetical protein
MINAEEEAYLANVMDEWRARTRWAETGSTWTPSDLTDLQKRELAGRFMDAVTDLVFRGWLTLHESESPLTDRELADALEDTSTWISTISGDHRMVELRTTSAWGHALTDENARP